MTLTALPVRPVPPYERVALVLPGGGALGAYQVGVYQAMDELGVRPDWVAGVSIGALNGAIIAGNPPEQRVRRLQEFWRSISQQSYWPWPVRSVRLVHDVLSTMQASLLGNPGFFRPWLVNPWLAPRGSDSALSYYDPLPIRRALERFVDFDRIRAGETRLSLGAVNARTGQVRYFDSTRDDIGVEHVLASLALPPAFPPVEIEGELYWDGGVVSNTPLDAVLEDTSRLDTLCVMVDLLSAEGVQPSGMDEVLARIKEIGFASRTDTSLAHFQEKHQLRRAIGALIDELPAAARRHPEVKALAQLGRASTMTIVRLAHRADGVQLSQEYDFSEPSVEDRRRAGYEDAVTGYARLRKGGTPSATATSTGVSIYDFNAASPVNAESPELEEQPAKPVEAA
jgi:NTE family protein